MPKVVLKILRTTARDDTKLKTLNVTVTVMINIYLSDASWYQWELLLFLVVLLFKQFIIHSW